MAFTSYIRMPGFVQFLGAKSFHQSRILSEDILHSNMKLFQAKALPVLLIMVVMSGLAEQGNSQTCASTFFSSLIQLIPCRAAVAPFSTIPPSPACCNAVKTLGQPCLCVLVNGPPVTGVDRNMAMQLPDKCSANFESCGVEK